MSLPRPRVAILLARTQDSRRWAQRYARGEVRDSSPYGYELAGTDFTLAWGSSRQEGVLAARIRRRVSAWLGFDLLHAWRNRRLLLSADVIWTHTEREHLAVALLQRCRPWSRRVPVLAQSVWLWDRWSGYGHVRRAFYAWLLRAHSIELVLSRVNLEFSKATVPGRRVEMIPFGTSTPGRSGLRMEGAGRKLVVAVGNDADRDWSTVAQVARSLPALDFRLATHSRAARSIEWPANVSVAPTASIAELDALYGRAEVIVVVTQANRHASGATSLIEALATGRPTVASAAGGLDDYAGDDARLVAPGDESALAEAVSAAAGRLTQPPSSDGIRCRGLTQADYVRRYVLVTEWVLGLTERPEDAFLFVSQFRSGIGY